MEQNETNSPKLIHTQLDQEKQNPSPISPFLS